MCFDDMNDFKNRETVTKRTQKQFEEIWKQNINYNITERAEIQISLDV